MKIIEIPDGEFRCCCGEASDVCGCSGITPATLLKCTIASTDCPDMDGETFNLVYDDSFTWISGAETPGCLSGSVSFRCNGTANDASDYQIKNDLEGNVYCDIDPLATWETPDTAACSPFRFTLEVTITDTSGLGYCGCCTTSPGTFTITIEEQ